MSDSAKNQDEKICVIAGFIGFKETI